MRLRAPGVLVVFTLGWLLSGCSSAGVEGLEVRDPDSAPQTQAVRDVVASDYASRVDLLALGYADGRFEVRSPAPHHVLSRGKHASTILNVALSPDGRFLATADARGFVAISEIESGSYGLLPRLTDGDLKAVGLAWDGTSKRLAIAAAGHVRVVEPESGASTEKSYRMRTSAVAFNPAVDELLVAGKQLSYLSLPGLDLLRHADPPLIRRGEYEVNVLDVRFSSDGRWLGVLTKEGIALLDVPAGTTSSVDLTEMAPVGLRFAADGRLAVFGRGALYVGPASAAEILSGIRKTSGTLWDVEFRQDGSLMLLGDKPDAELASLLE
jgi:WD40 repeat protein